MSIKECSRNYPEFPTIIRRGIGKWRFVRGEELPIGSEVSRLSDATLLAKRDF
jgi:hypothetical protein